MAIGRDPQNQVQLHDSEVSRRHARIVRCEEGLQLVDLGSSNGTYVNTERIEERLLRSGDRLLLGRTLMIFTGDEDASSLAMADEVDIVEPPIPDGSRIIKSVPQEEGSMVFAGDALSSDSWLARTRSNLQVMYRTSMAVSHTLDIDRLLERIIELIFEWLEVDRGCIMLLDRNTQELTPKVYRTRNSVKEEERLQISQTILDYVMTRQEGVLTTNAREDERWDTAASILKMGIREAICVPMRGRYGIVGVIYIDTYTPPGQVVQDVPANRFTEEHLKLTVAIGHQAALAVEDTAYYSAMVQAERLAAVGQTIATLSHHVKNILQGVRGGSYLIEEGLKQQDTELIQRGWAIVDRNQEKISNLVLDMLTFSKGRQPELQPADLNEVVSDVIELMQLRAQELSVTLKWTPDPTIPRLTFDPDALHRAVLNIVTNAIDACENADSGCVCVSTSLSADRSVACVSVEDNGAGISPEDIKTIFSVFESRKGSRGTGLGLPVSQKIMQEHGGDIRVESQLGVGSKFYLEFPAVPPDNDEPEAPLTEPMPIDQGDH